MKILMVLEQEFPPDNRVEKEAFSLIAAGHEVHLACYSRKDQFEREEKYKRIVIHRIGISRLMYKLSAAILVLPFYVWFWKKFLFKLQNKYHFDAVHIHDLPLSKNGDQLCKRYGLKLVLDQHEFYSNWIIHTAHYNTPAGKIIKSLSPWKKYEKKYLTKADLVITVEEPLKKIYIKEYDIPDNRILCIPNVPLKSTFNTNNLHKEIIDRYSNRFIILYVGGMDVLRGIETAIAAMPMIKEHIPRVKLLLIGKIVKPFNPFLLAKKYDVEGYIEYIKHQPIEIIPSYISVSSVCFFTPLLNREEIHSTIATKIYQYVAMGKPVIVSNAKMMADFISKNKLGFVIKEKDSQDFANRVLELYNNPVLIQQIKENGLRIFNQFFWEEKISPLLAYYNKPGV